MEDFTALESQRMATSAVGGSQYDYMDRHLLESFAESFLDSSYHMPVVSYPFAPPLFSNPVAILPATIVPLPIPIRTAQGALQSLSNLEALDMKMHSEMFPFSSNLAEMPESFDMEGDQDEEAPTKKGSTNNAAKERRRERNKVLARKTRIKKKAEMEAMGDRVLALMVENERLRNLVQQQLPTISVQGLLASDMTLPKNIMAMVYQMVRNNDKSEMNEISIKQRSFCLVNPNANDYPIVYTSPGFMQLTGYSREETIGRNCRFLQGPDTDMSEVALLKEALTEQTDVTVVLLNYHKNGTPFWNKIELAHMRDINGKVSFIVGLQSPCGPHCIRTRLARRKTFSALTKRSCQDEQPQHSSENRLTSEALDSNSNNAESKGEQSSGVGKKRDRSEGSTTTEPSDPSESGDSKSE